MSTLSASQIAGYARQGGFAGAEVPIAVAIALAESGGRTDVTHVNSDGSVDHGLWQINDVNARILASGNWRDPLDNARMAYAVYRQQGWRAWSVFKSGSYAKYLSEATTGAGTPTESSGLGAPGTGPFDDLAKTAKFLTNPHTWLRLAMILTGGLLLLIGLTLLGWKNTPQTIKTAAKQTAEAAATKGVA